MGHEIVPLGKDTLDTAMDRLGLTRLPASAFRPSDAHTSIVLGNNQVGHVLKVICGATGQIVQLPCYGVGGRLKEPYPVCKFCGHSFSGKAVIAGQAEYVVETDNVCAWPGLPWYVDALMEGD